MPPGLHKRLKAVSPSHPGFSCKNRMSEIMARGRGFEPLRAMPNGLAIRYSHVECIPRTCGKSVALPGWAIPAHGNDIGKTIIILKFVVKLCCETFVVRPGSDSQPPKFCVIEISNFPALSVCDFWCVFHIWFCALGASRTRIAIWRRKKEIGQNLYHPISFSEP